MAGIYLHIPFCRQACAYCNFHFTTSLRYKDQLIGAMVKEAIAEKGYFGDEQVDTIYFGGGTPSLLEEADYVLLLDTLRKHYTIAPDAEISFEANPDDINPEKLRAWKNAGINRLSIGVQSFFEEELRWMNRAHNAAQALRCIEQAREEGFNNFSIDLIYGSPLLTDEGWKKNVDRATELQVPHLSCYALTVEEKTPLHLQINRKKKQGIDPDKQAAQFLSLMEWLRQRGYEHYEVSNFAKPGFRSRHNSSYWKGISYLGLGPSAHSYHQGQRRWNIANNQAYINEWNAGKQARTIEILTEQQKLNEYIMISLRTAEGMNLDEMEKNWGYAARKKREEQLVSLMARGWIRKQGAQAQLTDEGMLMADGIASELFE